MADLVLLQTVIAGYAALVQTVQVWHSTRDRAQTMDAFDVARTLFSTNPATLNQARALSIVIPQDVADLVDRRFNGCWTSYYRILDPRNNASDEDVDNAELALIKCACREAKRIFDLSGENIPAGPMRDFWDLHRCWEIIP